MGRPADKHRIVHRVTISSQDLLMGTNETVEFDDLVVGNLFYMEEPGGKLVDSGRISRCLSTSRSIINEHGAKTRGVQVEQTELCYKALPGA